MLSYCITLLVAATSQFAPTSSRRLILTPHEATTLTSLHYETGMMSKTPAVRFTVVMSKDVGWGAVGFRASGDDLLMKNLDITAFDLGEGGAVYTMDVMKADIGEPVVSGELSVAVSTAAGRATVSFYRPLQVVDGYTLPVEKPFVVAWASGGQNVKNWTKHNVRGVFEAMLHPPDIVSECDEPVCGDQDCEDPSGVVTRDDFRCLCGDEVSVGTRVANCTGPAPPTAKKGFEAFKWSVILGGSLVVVSLVFALYVNHRSNLRFPSKPPRKESKKGYAEFPAFEQPETSIVQELSVNEPGSCSL